MLDFCLLCHLNISEHLNLVLIVLCGGGQNLRGEN